VCHETRDRVRLIDGWEQYKTLWDGMLVILATVVLMLVVGSGVVRGGAGMFNAMISLR
jgi:hypothetical protein